jgi:transposase-like protein
MPMFKPPFCPYKRCHFHYHQPNNKWWHKIGFHSTKCFGSVPRFRCQACGRTFSTQTFATNYYAKRKINYARLEKQLSSSTSIRAASRLLGCSCGSVLNRIDRLARQALAAQTKLRPQAKRNEDVCIDGLVSFDRSQYFPNDITISIASDSRYVLAFTHATHRRSGNMRPSQKLRRDEIYRGVDFERRALERSFSELVDELELDRSPKFSMPLVITTDEKLEYVRALSRHRLYRDQDDVHRVVHRRVNSRLPRSFLNPLFPSNYLDREIRKDQAAHRRQTTCFARSVANGLSRLACYFDWHNYEKRFLIKAPVAEDTSHGEEAGIPRRSIILTRRRMFRERAFLSLTDLDGLEEKIWKKSFPTPGFADPAYLPAFAFG